MPIFRRREAFQDMRKSPRHEVDYLALIDPGDGRDTYNCIICDISAVGAKLTVVHKYPTRNPTPLPRYPPYQRCDDFE